MEESEYKIELRKILDEHSDDTIKKLNFVLKIIPEKSKSIELMIFPNQEGEGSFGVHISLTGSDLYVLNRLIADSASIFNVKYTTNGLEPNVPMMDTFEPKFDVNIVLSNVVSKWLKSIWNQATTENIKLPVTIIADEGYGTILLIRVS